MLWTDFVGKIMPVLLYRSCPWQRFLLTHNETSCLVFLCWKCYIPPKTSDLPTSSCSYFPQIHLQIIQLTDGERNKGKKLNGFPAQSPSFSNDHVKDINSRAVYKSIISTSSPIPLCKKSAKFVNLFKVWNFTSSVKKISENNQIRGALFKGITSTAVH